jgi:Arc/MetJ-type ribon-helix-helix transcriptional regulator
MNAMIFFIFCFLLLVAYVDGFVTSIPSGDNLYSALVFRQNLKLFVKLKSSTFQKTKNKVFQQFTPGLIMERKNKRKRYMKHHTLEDGLYATRGLNEKYEVILRILRKEEETQKAFHETITDPVIKQAIIGTQRTTKKKTRDEKEIDEKKKSGSVKKLEKEKMKAKLEAEAKKKKDKEKRQRMAKKK